MSLIPGISGQATQLVDGLKVDSISENTNGNGIIFNNRIVQNIYPQVSAVVKTNGYSTTSQTPSDVPGLSITITPRSVNSKFKIIASLSCYATGGGAGSCCCTYLVNGSGTVFNKHRTTSTDGHFIPAVLAWIDSPATTSPVTYKVQLSNNQYVGGTATINQDPVYESSTLLVEEIL